VVTTAKNDLQGLLTLLFIIEFSDLWCIETKPTLYSQ